MNELPRAPLSVLVVEDLQDVAESVADLLTMSGHTVRVASCGADALHVALAEPPDVVLLDIGLPGMSGWEVARRLRTQSNGKQPVVVAVTGHGTDDDRLRSADAGIDLHLVKPADPATLTALLSRVHRLMASRDETGPSEAA
ncbi:response regulator [Gemmata sp. G18]|uniref:Response regulator n=1 Tax=Gemmata palustris TaxID=2822762 RepID=A0ABS5BPP0_9BACT|nr:response regulator [Gemmata palustris]MBP3955681.1 response regulator [Gemmata palustris]